MDPQLISSVIPMTRILSVKRWKKYLRERFGVNNPSDLLIDCLRDPSKIKDDEVFERFIHDYEQIYILDMGRLDGENEFTRVFFMINLEADLRGYDVIIKDKINKAMEEDATIRTPRDYVNKYILPEHMR